MTIVVTAECVGQRLPTYNCPLNAEIQKWRAEEYVVGSVQIAPCENCIIYGRAAMQERYKLPPHGMVIFEAELK